LEYTVTEWGTFTLKFEVERNGVSNSRTSNVLVVKPFVPKTYNKKSIAYITVDGSLPDVQWDHITHLIISSAVIDADGLPDFTFGGRSTLDIPTLISSAHNYGVYVLIEFSGVLSSYLHAGPAYASYNFYNAAINPDKRKALIAAMFTYASTMGFDGIDIYMDKAADGAFPPADAPEFQQFYADVVSAAPATTERGKFLLSMTLVTGWTKGAFDVVVVTPGYDWINVHAFNATDLFAMPHAPSWLTVSDCADWESAGFKPSRIAATIPAFGIHFNSDLTGIGWGNWDTYARYISYREITNQYPDAPSRDMISDNGDLYYNGLPTVGDKAGTVLSKDYGGLGLWAIENDNKDSAKSLMKKINDSLGNTSME
jgi:hypothetical protein